jgi:large subunit ribosomal protein L35
MPKMKSSRTAQRKFKVTGSGRLRRRKAFRGHLMEKKSSTRARRLGRDSDVAKGQGKNIKKLLGL